MVNSSRTSTWSDTGGGSIFLCFDIISKVFGIPTIRAKARIEVITSEYIFESILFELNIFYND
ncbi:MAG TPA: hypothetical protein VHJ38_15785 [Nitrososphaeraceae archaeon]|nr:hypothetical protein [Nitrososphaeraceae archaeon]